MEFCRQIYDPFSNICLSVFVVVLLIGFRLSLLYTTMFSMMANTVSAVFGAIGILMAQTTKINENRLLKFTIKYPLIYIVIGGITTWIIANLFPVLMPKLQANTLS